MCSACACRQAAVVNPTWPRFVIDPGAALLLLQVAWQDLQSAAAGQEAGGLQLPCQLHHCQAHSSYLNQPSIRPSTSLRSCAQHSPNRSSPVQPAFNVGPIRPTRPVSDSSIGVVISGTQCIGRANEAFAGNPVVCLWLVCPWSDQHLKCSVKQQVACDQRVASSQVGCASACAMNWILLCCKLYYAE
jgi:hypothetical protein